MKLIFCVLVLVFTVSSHAALKPGDSMGKFRNSWYFLIEESTYANDPKTENLLDMKGNVLVTVSKGFKKEVTMEGSGKLEDGRVINYAGKVKGQTRFQFVSAPFGMGVGDCELEPLHSIAVDPKTIPLGSLVRIKETVGLVFPDGTVHDGLWRAVDVGSAIQGDRIDLFMGPGRDNGKFLEKSGIDYLDSLSLELVELPAANSCTTK